MAVHSPTDYSGLAGSGSAPPGEGYGGLSTPDVATQTGEYQNNSTGMKKFRLDRYKIPEILMPFSGRKN
jgi:hypothetical protein